MDLDIGRNTRHRRGRIIRSIRCIRRISLFVLGGGGGRSYGGCGRGWCCRSFGGGSFGGSSFGGGCLCLDPDLNGDRRFDWSGGGRITHLRCFRLLYREHNKREYNAVQS
jgi:hypothetical protein